MSQQQHLAAMRNSVATKENIVAIKVEKNHRKDVVIEFFMSQQS